MKKFSFKTPYSKFDYFILFNLRINALQLISFILEERELYLNHLTI